MSIPFELLIHAANVLYLFACLVPYFYFPVYTTTRRAFRPPPGNRTARTWAASTTPWIDGRYRSTP